jgi:nicotinamidase-related amidase
MKNKKSSNGVLDSGDSVLLVVDFQEKFRPVIHGWDEALENVVRLAKGCNILGVPVVVTEQYPKGLGETVRELKAIMKSEPLEKTSFSCMGDEGFREKIKSLGKHQIILCGIEAHVCVLNSALDLKEAGFEVHVVADAVSSRRSSDKEIALERMKQSGVFLASSEMVLFQLLKDAKRPEFREISRLVK